MMRNTLGAICAVLFTLATGCAGPNRAFLLAKAEGDRAIDAGRYDDAARAYHEAALKAGGRAHDRDYALFLEASTYQRAGRVKEAISSYEALAQLSPKGERTARAVFDRAELEIRFGDAPKGWQMLEEALVRYPDEGSSSRAFNQLVDHAEEQSPGSGGLAWLDAHRDQFSKGALSQDFCYSHAKRVEAQGKQLEARDEFVACAKAHPYPSGALTDDAWFHAAQIDEKLGNPRAAIEDLRAMLAPLEIITFAPGSYDRPRFPPAQFHIAELYRDLKDDRMARIEFRKLYDQHKTSILRPSALWQEGLAAKRMGDDAAVCEIMKKLVKEQPESRFTACAQKLCTSVEPPPKSVCRSYIDPTSSEQRLKPPPSTPQLKPG